MLAEQLDDTMAKSKSSKAKATANDEEWEPTVKPKSIKPKPKVRRPLSDDELKNLKLVPEKDRTCHDILLGRGNAVSSSTGNTLYRQIIFKYRDQYIGEKREKKHEIAEKVIADVYSLTPPGRFLDRHSDGMYREVPYARILEKCCQSLREKKYTPVSSTLSLKETYESSTSETRSVGRKSPAKAVPRKKLTRTKSNRPGKARKRVNTLPTSAAEQPDTPSSDPDHDAENVNPEDRMDVDEKVPIVDKTSFINAKKLLLGNKVQSNTNPPPLEEPPLGLQSNDGHEEVVEESENDVFDGMFNMLPLSLVEFYSSQGHCSEGQITRAKTREEAIESPTTVVDDFAFIQPVPLQMAHSLYLEGESKWVNPGDNVTANVVATWTEFATNGCFAKYG